MMMKPATQPLPKAHKDETLSAFLDGELPDEEARQMLRELGKDAGSQTLLWDYIAVGDALRGLHAGTTDPHLTHRVMAALEQEPTVLAPMRQPRDRRVTLWLAAAAITAITWGLWQNLPEQAAPVPMAAKDTPSSTDMQAYLAAHQDFAQAVIAPAEMNFTQVSLAEVRP